MSTVAREPVAHHPSAAEGTHLERDCRHHARELEHCEDTEAAELQVSERASVENLLRAVLHADGWWRQNIKL